jgi:ATP-dependent RNA helicase DDX21
MDRKDKSVNHFSSIESSKRKFAQFDSNGSATKFEHSLTGVSKKLKNEKPNQTMESEFADFDIKNEKIKLTLKDNPMLAELDDSCKLEKFRIKSSTITHLNSLGITHLFPIQAATYDHVYEEKDLIARDKTGSGKTLSYVLPICENFRNKGLFKNKPGQKPLMMVVLPTRELVIQVSNVLTTVKSNDTEYRVISIYGGTEIRSQIFDLKRGIDIVVGTPGRLLDLIERKAISFSELKIIVLDEADEMLNMGFQEDIEKIYQAIHSETDKDKIQSLLFSATIPSWVHEVSKKYLRQVDLVNVDLVKAKGYKTPTTVKHLAINCPYFSRNGAIGDIVLCYGGQHARTIIFTETKREANDILLEAHIKQECQVLHGDIPQKQREITFRAFREGKFKCLIATNVAARGLDIPEVDLIMQLSPPKEVDTYIHRAGRTARAGRTGVCVTFYTKNETGLLERIENKAHFTFQKIGAPQPHDIIKANARDIVTGIKKVPHEVVNLFDDIADELLENLGAKESLCRALAIISGTNEKFKQRSLLCSIEGYITYAVETDTEFRHLAFIWNFLNKHFQSEITDSIKGMKSYKNNRGAVFDVPEQYESNFQEFIDNNPNLRNFILRKADALPEIQEDNSRRGSTTFSYNKDSKVVRSKDDVKVFVGGLPYDAKEDDIREFFNNEGGLTAADVLILRDDSGNSKGVGFVIFRTKEDAGSACRLTGKKLKNRMLRINMANEKPGASRR